MECGWVHRSTTNEYTVCEQPAGHTGEHDGATILGWHYERMASIDSSPAPGGPYRVRLYMPDSTEPFRTVDTRTFRGAARIANTWVNAGTTGH